MSAAARSPRRGGTQLALFAREREERAQRTRRILCAACHEKEARYGFRDEEALGPPSTLCFECFRLEIARRQERRDAQRMKAPARRTRFPARVQPRKAG